MPTTTASPKKPATKATPKANGKAAAKPSKERPIKHETFEVKKYVGANALRATQAMDLLGWEEETADVKFGEDFLFTDFNKKKIRCWNNMKNRPFTESWAKARAWDILKRNWRLNGETIIIGKTGLILSGQHRLIALILAYQMWMSEAQKHHWLELWPTEPVIECVISYGVDETDDVTRTIDNVRPRTLSDVLYTSSHFGKVKKHDRGKLCSMIDFAIRMLWDRTGMKNAAFKPKQTHSESLEFLDHHPRLLKAVNHIFTENADKKISRYMPPGYASALLYLMAACTSDVDAYQLADPRTEKKLDFENWDKACEFWVCLGKSPDFHEVRQALASLNDPETGVMGSKAERMAVIIKAWNMFVDGQTLEGDGLSLAYTENEDGIMTLDEHPTVGGIDLGDNQDDAEEDSPSESTTDTPTDDTEEEIKKDKKPSKKAVFVADKLKEMRKTGKKPKSLKEAVEEDEQEEAARQAAEDEAFDNSAEIATEELPDGETVEDGQEGTPEVDGDAPEPEVDQEATEDAGAKEKAKGNGKKAAAKKPIQRKPANDFKAR